MPRAQSVRSGSEACNISNCESSSNYKPPLVEAACQDYLASSGYCSVSSRVATRFHSGNRPVQPIFKLVAEHEALLKPFLRFLVTTW